MVDMSKHGGRLQKRRPVLVIQNDVANERSGETIIAGIRDPHGKKLPVFVQVPTGTAGLLKDSVVDAGHLLTVHQEILLDRLGSLPSPILAQVDRALAGILGLPGWQRLYPIGEPAAEP